jgi:tetratricopeptide (TPR) repeat protein
MSYINDALKKAQRERDSRYERFGGIIASGSLGREKSVKRKHVIGLAIGLIVLISVGLVTGYLLKSPSVLQKGSHEPAVLERDATKQPVPTTREAVPAMGPDGADVFKGTETIPIPGGSAATAQTDGRPMPPPASSPVSDAANRREAEVRYREALTAQHNKDFKRAEELYKQVLALDHDHVRAMNNLGVLLMDQKKRREAVALFNRAIALKKEYVDPHYNLACVYGRMDEIEESLIHLKKAIAINKEAIQWAMKDADLKSVVASSEFKKIREE